MDQSQTRIAWIVLSAVLGAAMFSMIAGRFAPEPSVELLIVTWIAGALAGSVFAWRVGTERLARKPTKDDLKFTREGWSAVGWLCVLLLPPVGVALGIWLLARGSSQGRPMIISSVAAMAVYSTLTLIV